MINPKFIEALDSLNLPKDGYAIFGSGPLGIRNIRDCRDLDIVVTDDLYKTLKDQYREVEPGKLSIEDGVDVISGEHTKLKNYELVIKRSEEINGYKFISIPDLIEWKRERGRAKDLEDLVLIKEYLNNLQ